MDDIVGDFFGLLICWGSWFWDIGVVCSVIVLEFLICICCCCCCDGWIGSVLIWYVGVLFGVEVKFCVIGVCRWILCLDDNIRFWIVIFCCEGIFLLVFMGCVWFICKFWFCCNDCIDMIFGDIFVIVLLFCCFWGFGIICISGFGVVCDWFVDGRDENILIIFIDCCCCCCGWFLFVVIIIGDFGLYKLWVIICGVWFWIGVGCNNGNIVC